MYRLHGHRGWGSALIEAQLEWYGLPFAFVDVGNPFKSAQAEADLAEVRSAGRLLPVGLHRGDGRQGDSGKHRHDGDHDQQLD